MIVLTNDKLEQTIKESSKLILVDMYADWCGPCKMIEPIIEEIAKDYEQNLEVIKVNVDENPVSAAAYGVRSIPTLLVFDKGELVKKQSGAIPKKVIIELFEKFLV